MRLGPKILSGLCIGFVAIQFIQPARNKSTQVLPTDIINLVSVPDQVSGILQNSCYDCHSNNTRYPWYSFIQPGGWLMASHIRKGKTDLNFSEFGSYSTRKQQGKLQAITNSINDKTMPLRSYTLLHSAAKLSADEKVVLLDWVKRTQDSLSSRNK